MKTKVIYTSLVGNYDELPQPRVIKDDYDFICFTDDICKDSIGVWKVKPIPYDCKNNLRKSRYVKLLPHRVLNDYEVSVWMDANIQIINERFYYIIDKLVANDVKIAQLPHLLSNSVYTEIRNAFYGGKVKAKEAIKQYKHLKEMGFPDESGLFENNVIFRRHKNKDVENISEDWWNEYCNYSERDQFSLMYIYWKHGFNPKYIFDDKHNSRNCDSLKYIQHPSHVKRIEKGAKDFIVKKAIRSLYKHIVISLFLN